MTFDEFRLANTFVADLARERFGDRVAGMEFFINKEHYSTFQEAGGKVFLWYAYNHNSKLWHDTHILHGENWIYSSVKALEK